MGKMASPDKISDEELIRAITNPSNTSTYADVPDFISFYSIKEGKNEVKPALIYDLYSRWSENPVGRLVFFKYFSKFFDKAEKLPTKYLLSCSSLEMAEVPIKEYKSNNILTSKSWKEQMTNFFESYGITRGTHWTKAIDLYRMYTKFSKKQLSKRNFIILMDFYLEKKIARGTLWFKTNINEEKTK